MRLTSEQSDYLRILGHTLKPVVDVGAGGLTNSTLIAIDRALNDNELVKVRLPFGNKARRSRLIEDLVPKAHALLVLHGGSMALLYRPANHPTIKLPGSQINT